MPITISSKVTSKRGLNRRSPDLFNCSGNAFFLVDGRCLPVPAPDPFGVLCAPEWFSMYDVEGTCGLLFYYRVVGLFNNDRKAVQYRDVEERSRGNVNFSGGHTYAVVHW